MLLVGTVAAVGCCYFLVVSCGWLLGVVPELPVGPEVQDFVVVFACQLV